MKRKITSLIAICIMLMASATVAFADTNSQAISNSMDFQGTAIKLSLNDAVKRLTTQGPDYEAAVQNHDLLKTSEEAQQMVWQGLRAKQQATLQSPNPGMAVNPENTLEGKINVMNREFYVEQAELGLQIELGIMNRKATKSYYDVIHARETLKIAQDGLSVQNDILASTKKRFELGVSAKKDVLDAEATLETRKAQVVGAESAYKGERMKFNRSLNYPVMQNVEFSDSLTKVSAPSTTIKAAVEAGHANRNEIKLLEQYIKVAELELATAELSGKYSLAYKSKNLEIKSLNKSLQDTISGIEIELRGHYLSIEANQAQIDALTVAVDNAKETYRLAKLSYDNGLSTLTEVQGAEVQVYNKQLERAKAILDYNLAVYDFNQAMGYGTKAFSLAGNN